MLQEIKNDHIFGKCKGVVWTIEYQKRGLPHMHLLVFLETDATFLTADNIDRLISAELPEEVTEQGQQLGIIIRGSMVHTQCAGGNKNALCMKSPRPDQPQRCSKKYPREFLEETIVQANGYPLYRQRDSGKSFTIIGRGTAADIPVTIDNRYVVPYSPYLTGRYRAHVNVEICGSIQAIKYIYKYKYKENNQSAVQVLSEKDEVKRYLNGRYIGLTEAIWRLFEYKVHEEVPSVMHLSIHLPGEQAVYFPEGIDIQGLQDRLQNAHTTLTSFFDYNSNNLDGRQYLYQQFPCHYQFITKKGWQKRVAQGRTAIGRMYSASPFMGEKYNLRLLLTVVCGPQSFHHLRTVYETRYSTFKRACIALGLLENDGEWVATFTEGSTFASGYSLRQLFITALLYGTVVSPIDIWEQFKIPFCDDLPHRLASGTVPLPPNAIDGMRDVQFDYGLYLIQQMLQEFNKTLNDYSLPLPVLNWSTSQAVGQNSLIQEEQLYDLEKQALNHQDMFDVLNTEQLECYHKILQAVVDRRYEGRSPSFFLHGPAGTGKTFLYKCLCSFLRAKGQIVLCVASSGIAAQLLLGGRTAHSRL